jgi:hypothetical protein
VPAQSNEGFTMNNMDFRFLRVALMFLISNLFFLFPVSAQKADKEVSIYDGTIGADKIVLVAESKTPGFVKGVFVLNRGEAVEELQRRRK